MGKIIHFWNHFSWSYCDILKIGSHIYWSNIAIAADHSYWPTNVVIWDTQHMARCPWEMMNVDQELRYIMNQFFIDFYNKFCYSEHPVQCSTLFTNKNERKRKEKREQRGKRNVQLTGMVLLLLFNALLLPYSISNLNKEIIFILIMVYCIFARWKCTYL